MEKRSNRKNSNNAGFTLIEIILCVAILAIAFLPMLKYFSDSLQYTQKSKMTQMATLTAQTVLEEIKAKDSLESVKKQYEQEKLTTAGYEVNVALDATGKTAYLKLQKPVKIDGNTLYVVTEAAPDYSYKNTEIETMDSSKDIIVVENELMETNAILKFMTIHATACEAASTPEHTVIPITNEEYFKNDLIREIRMDFTVNADTVTVKTYYYYYLERSILGIIGVEENSPAATLVEEVLDTTVKRTAELNDSAIWVFYSAKPGDVSGNSLREKIIFNITGGSGAALADRLYFVCQNKDEINSKYMGYTAYTEKETGSPLLASSSPYNVVGAGGPVREFFANVVVSGTNNVQEIVTEKSDFSRKTSLNINVYKKDPTVEAGQEALVTLTGIYEGGVQ